MTSGYMRRAVLPAFLTTILLCDCGSSGSGSSSTQSGASAAPITYQLAVAPDTADYSTDGSYIYLSADPTMNDDGFGYGGRLSGTFQVVPEAPVSSDIVLEYRIVGVDLFPEGWPRGLPTEISVQSDDVGLIQLHADDTLDITLQLPIQYGISYVFEMSTQYNGINYPPNHPRYSVNNGQLILQGEHLQTVSGPPYYGTPGIVLYASPVS